MSELSDAIKTLSGYGDDNYESTICTVGDIDLAENTCTCTPIDGISPDFMGVILSVNKSKGFLIIPTDGSLVSVTQISEATSFISMVSDVDQVYLAGDENGGLINIVDLTTKLNALVTQLQAQLALIATGIIAGGGTYTPGTLTSFNKTNYENTKIKHGNG